MGLNSAREKERQAKLASRKDSKTWKPEDGPNVIRVLKFKHKVTKEDVLLKLYSKPELGTVQEEWCFPFTVQYGLLSENRKVPVASTDDSIALWKQLNKSTDVEDQKAAEKIRPNTKYAINIVDIDDPQGGVQTYLAAKTVREFIGKYVVDPDFGEAILGVKGRDLKIEYNSKAQSAKEFYSLILMDKVKSRALNSKVETLVKDFFDPEVNADFTGRVEGIEDLSAPNGESSVGKEDLEGKEEAPSNKAEKNGKKKEENEDIFDAD